MDKVDCKIARYGAQAIKGNQADMPGFALVRDVDLRKLEDLAWDLLSEQEEYAPRNAYLEARLALIRDVSMGLLDERHEAIETDESTGERLRDALGQALRILDAWKFTGEANYIGKMLGRIPREGTTQDD